MSSYSCGFFVLFCFQPRSAACRILVPRPGIELRPSAVKAQSPNHWTTREFPIVGLLNSVHTLQNLVVSVLSNFFFWEKYFTNKGILLLGGQRCSFHNELRKTEPPKQTTLSEQCSSRWLKLSQCYESIPVTAVGTECIFIVMNNVWTNEGNRMCIERVRSELGDRLNNPCGCPEVKELFLQNK